MEELLKEIGINAVGTLSRDGTYTIDIEDSDTFGKFFSILDKNPKVVEKENVNLNTYNNASLMYHYKTISIHLIADYDRDLYKLVATEDKSWNNGEEGEEEDTDEVEI